MSLGSGKFPRAVFALCLCTSGCGFFKRHEAPNRLPSNADASNCSTTWTYEANVTSFMTENCASCHSGDTPSGNIRLDTLVDDLDARSTVERWTLANSKLQSNKMPPGNDKRPADCEKLSFATWVATAPELQNADVSTPAPRGLTRLSRREYGNTLQDLLGDDVLAAVAPYLGQMPNDDAAGGYENMRWSLSSGHISAYDEIANQVEAYLQADAKHVKALIPCWNDEQTSNDCIADFVAAFGLRAFRRPLTASESAVIMALYTEKTTDPALDRLLDIFGLFLQSPSFLYKIETEGDLVSGDQSVLALDAYAIASRLSYLAWSSMPDDALFADAASGALKTTAGYAQAVQRLFASPRARANAHHFFRQWLNFDAFAQPDYSGSFLAGISSAKLKADAMAEAYDFIDSIIWGQGGTYQQLMMSSHAGTLTPNLGAIYGINVAAAIVPPELPITERAGLLTRVAVLAQGRDETHPIKRGSLLRQRILCDELALPDPAKLPPGSLSPPQLDASASTRERWEVKTSPAICQSCHTKINPLGFAWEAYDSLGRFRTSEAIYDNRGTILGTPPVDTRVSLALGDEDDQIFDSPTQVVEAIATSDKALNCFVKQWFRYSMNRRETRGDSNVVTTLEKLMHTDGLGIKDLFIQTALMPNFTMKTLEPAAD